MASLTGETVASTYSLLLKVEDTGIHATTQRLIEDGDANPSALKLSGAGITSTGALAVDGASTLTGAVTMGAAATVATTLGVTGVATLSDATDSSSSTTGGTIISGGCGIAKKLFIGTTLDVTGASALDGAVTMGAAATVATTLGVTGVLTASGGVTGDVTGDVKADDAAAIITSGADLANSSIGDGVTATTQTAGDDSTKIATTAYVDALTSVPTGAITQYAVAAAPTGWLLCDGAEYDETGTHAALFAIIGSTYNTGGETTDYFRVPDLRGRTPVGVGTGSYYETGTAAQTGTTVTGSGTAWTAEMVGLILVYADDTNVGAITAVNSATELVVTTTSEVDPAQAYTIRLTARTVADTGGAETHTLVTAEIPAHSHTYNESTVAGTGHFGSYGFVNDASASTGETGGDGDHENMSPFLVVNYIIKT